MQKESVVELAKIFARCDDPEKRTRGLSYLKQIVSDDVLSGIIEFIPLNELDQVLIEITKIRSNCQHVIKKTNGTFGAFRTRENESVYKWIVIGNDIKLDGFETFNHLEDGAFSQSTTRPGSPESPFQSHMTGNHF